MINPGKSQPESHPSQAHNGHPVIIEGELVPPRPIHELHTNTPDPANTAQRIEDARQAVGIVYPITSPHGRPEGVGDYAINVQPINAHQTPKAPPPLGRGIVGTFEIFNKYRRIGGVFFALKRTWAVMRERARR